MADKKGIKQTNDIKTLYKENFDDPQRLSFLLGRISALLDMGNAISDAINEAIKNDEETYNMVIKRIQKDHDDIAKAKEKKPTTRKRTIAKKEVKKDEK